MSPIIPITVGIGCLIGLWGRSESLLSATKQLSLTHFAARAERLWLCVEIWHNNLQSLWIFLVGVTPLDICVACVSSAYNVPFWQNLQWRLSLVSLFLAISSGAIMDSGLLRDSQWCFFTPHISSLCSVGFLMISVIVNFYFPPITHASVFVPLLYSQPPRNVRRTTRVSDDWIFSEFLWIFGVFCFLSSTTRDDFSVGSGCKKKWRDAEYGVYVCCHYGCCCSAPG